MSFIDEFQADLDCLPNVLQKKYALLRDLDKSLEDLKMQNGNRCEQEIDSIRRGNRPVSALDTSFMKFSDEALDEQRHSIRIADEKVALAVQAYDLVDAHIQQLDQYLKKVNEEARRAAASGNAVSDGATVSNSEGTTKQGRGGRGGRKKKSLASAAAIEAAANPTGVDLDIPVDPNEPTYCFCNQVSYGEMVACDNPNCKIEWFHFGCVGLKERPKGKWYCSECAATKQRRKR